MVYGVNAHLKQLQLYLYFIRFDHTIMKSDSQAHLAVSDVYELRLNI